ncbi:MAG: LacI family DNA-binding transcriptional regulator [Actinomycetota bacterium]|nr:LacI family DNA-binding transcriptional regulator [Actinomycetota bacterium]
MKKVRLKDIAQRTGFTANTVSRALKDKKDISEKTKNYIAQVAKEMGYIPNNIAGSLRLGKTKTVATIIPDISDPLIAIWLNDIETRLRNSGYNTFIINTEEKYENEEEAIFLALSKNVDGIILCPTQKKNDDIKMLARQGTPFILLGRRFHDIKSDYVISDDIKGAFLAVDYLLKNGYKNILFVNGPIYISSARERLEGYKNALRINNIDYKEELVRESAVISGNSTLIMHEIINEKLDFDAVFAFSDMMAWEIIYTLQNMNITEYKNIPVIGYDNIQSRFFYPFSLTTVSYSKRQIAYQAVDILLNKIKGKYKNSVEQHIVETKLIVR